MAKEVFNIKISKERIDSYISIFQFLGILILLHDLKDFPKLDRFHHWQIGAAMMLLHTRKT